jgi:predicted TIM-barrel fold metal-dependent hydrolase
MPNIIDFHTHAFPDALAEKAMAALLAESGDYKAYTNGTLSGLIRSMDASGIRTSVIANIATKPSQAAPILDWSLQIAGERILPFASVHPESPDAPGEIRRAAEAGLKGLKFHPMYQNFTVDDPGLLPLFTLIRDLNLVVLLHAGFDIAFPDDRRAEPQKIARLADSVPGIKLVAAHAGGWQDWDSVGEVLCGKDIFFDTSFFHEATEDQRRNILRRHPVDRILFGSDSPWTDQSQSLAYAESWFPETGALEKVLSLNAQSLLELGDHLANN